MRETIDPAARIGRAMYNLLHRRGGTRHDARRQMIPVRPRPGRRNIIRRNAQRRRIDRARAAQRTQRHRAVEVSSARIGDAAEPEGFAVLLGKAAELQPYQRHDFRVLAYRFVDDVQQVAFAQGFQIIT